MIDLGGLLDFFWVVLVVRYGVMTIGHANRAIAAVATFARDHAADNAGHVGLIRDHDEIHHQRSEEHTSELQSQSNLVCRLLLEKKKKTLSTFTANYNISQTCIIHLTRPIHRTAVTL